MEHWTRELSTFLLVEFQHERISLRTALMKKVIFFFLMDTSCQIPVLMFLFNTPLISPNSLQRGSQTEKPFMPPVCLVLHALFCQLSVITINCQFIMRNCN